MSNDVTLEQQIIGLGLTAPRITPEQIDAMVEKLSFHTYVIPGTTTTVASAIDPQGFVVALGTAAAVSAANFNESIGRNHSITKAKAAARDELWKLEGYRLSKNLFEAARVGLISGLSAYHSEGLGDDAAFVADVAAGYCVANLRRGPIEIDARPVACESGPGCSAPRLHHLGAP
ncbi:hypothetical protein ALQ33_200023 [Pseudomonas syringae pv. philadelphi]|uniref:Uncharacterized protein n=1 Tax=Pseudomonas syringae pv. philadelphi TaxID=251706 RepID=A0A3M3YBD9_9PSED|nr:Gp49 family protein [Pseudomonas syringae group genomosp. 3]RMO79772.1 hypothetical protein ALQ33_200023 [Pseudomonas syringae pv. philadelphi]